MGDPIDEWKEFRRLNRVERQADATVTRFRKHIEKFGQSDDLQEALDAAVKIASDAKRDRQAYEEGVE